MAPETSAEWFYGHLIQHIPVDDSRIRGGHAETKLISTDNRRLRCLKNFKKASRTTSLCQVPGDDVFGAIAPKYFRRAHPGSLVTSSL